MANKASTDKAKAALVAQTAAEPKPEGMTIAKYLDAQKPAIMDALPRNVDVDRFTRIVLTTVRQQPKLLACRPISLLAAVMQAAQLGLEPGNGLNECHLVPYKQEVSFQLGYRGAVKLATNTDVVRAVWAEAVYAQDHFRVRMGTDPAIEHIPALSGEGRGTFDATVAAYAVARLANGETQFAVMSREEIEKHRDRYSKAAAKPDSPWQDALGAVEMAKKTVVLRLSKMLPLSAEVSRVFAADGAVRHELSADMAMVPDASEERVPAEAIGASGEEDGSAAPYAYCTQCQATVMLTDDATADDVEQMVCDCGGSMRMGGGAA